MQLGAWTKVELSPCDVFTRPEKKEADKHLVMRTTAIEEMEWGKFVLFGPRARNNERNRRNALMLAFLGKNLFLRT